MYTNINYLTVCCIYLCYKNENLYSDFATETFTPNQRHPSKSISIHFPKVWLTLGKSFLLSGPPFPHLESEWVGLSTLTRLPSHRMRLIQVLFQLCDFSYAFISQWSFFSRLVFLNHSVLMEPKYLSIFLLFNLQRNY